MAEIRVKNEEAKTIPFTITRNSQPLDVSAATGIYFVVKETYQDTSYLIEKTLSDFDTSLATSGIVSCTLTTTDLAYTNIPGNPPPEGKKYISEFKVDLLATDVDISAVIDFVVERSLYS